MAPWIDSTGADIFSKIVILFPPGLELLDHVKTCVTQKTCTWKLVAVMLIITKGNNLDVFRINKCWDTDDRLGNKKEPMTGTCNNTSESEKHYAKLKEARSRLYNVWLHVYDILENRELWDRKLASGFPGLCEEGSLHRDTRKTLNDGNG